MKAILIIDMPKGCIDCPCHDTELLYCKTMEQHAEYFYEKPSWCPLKELPEKRTINGAVSHGIMTDDVGTTVKDYTGEDDG